MSRRAVIVAFVAALLATAIGFALFPLGISRSEMASSALKLWALLLAPGICLLALVFPPNFPQSHFWLAMTAGFIFNVLTWTGVFYGVMLGGLIRAGETWLIAGTAVSGIVGVAAGLALLRKGPNDANSKKRQGS